jgi:tetratricopeptide (TPR) repeat protein
MARTSFRDAAHHKARRIMAAAFAEEKTGHLSAALKRYEEATQLDPSFVDPYLLSAKIYTRVGRLAEAENQLRKAILVNPGSFDVLLALGAHCAKDGRSAEAVDLSEKALLIQPLHIGARYLIARAMLESGRPEEARKHLLLIPELGPSPGETYANVGSALQQFGFMEDAEVMLFEATKLNPLLGPSYYHLAQGRKIRSPDDPILKQLERGASQPSLHGNDRAHIEFALGKAFEDLAEYETAIRHYDDANALAFAELETSGRAFNHQASTEQFRRARESSSWLETHGEACESEAPVFIVGMMRSGTTLVDQILSCHSRIASGGELDFWPEVSHQFQSKGIPPSTIQRRDIGERYLALNRTANGKLKFLDKMPHNFLALGTILSVFPNAKIIHCRRNLIASAFSIYTTPFRNPPPFAHSRENIRYFAREHETLMSHWRQCLDQRQLTEIDYESLVSEPATVIGEILRFLGLEEEEACFSHYQQTRCVSTPSLWQVRQPLYASSIDRWKRFEPWLKELTQLGTQVDD